MNIVNLKECTDQQLADVMFMYPCPNGRTGVNITCDDPDGEHIRYISPEGGDILSMCGGMRVYSWHIHGPSVHATIVPPKARISNRDMFKYASKSIFEIAYRIPVEWADVFGEYLDRALRFTVNKAPTWTVTYDVQVHSGTGSYAYVFALVNANHEKEHAKNSKPTRRCYYCGRTTASKIRKSCSNCGSSLASSPISVLLSEDKQLDGTRESWHRKVGPLPQYPNSDIYVSGDYTNRAESPIKGLVRFRSSTMYTPTSDNQLEQLLKSLRASEFPETRAHKAGVVVTSNVGNPCYPVTTQFLRLAGTVTDKELESAGLGRVMPSGIATNPRERYHYVDSVLIYLKSPKKYRLALAKLRANNA